MKANKADYDRINSAEFLEAVLLHGENADRLWPSVGAQVKKRFDPDLFPRPAGEIEIKDNAEWIELEYDANPGWGAGSDAVFGFLHLIAQTGDDTWTSWPVLDLRRNDPGAGDGFSHVTYREILTAIGVIPEEGTLAGFWIGSRAPAFLRTDVMPFRVPAGLAARDEAPSPEPPSPPLPDPGPPLEPAPGLRGAPWPITGDGRAPVLASSPTGEQSNNLWNDWLENIYPKLIEMGVEGTHSPLDGAVIPEFEYLYRLNSALHAADPNRGITALWCGFEGRITPGNALAVVRNLVALYDNTPNPGPMIVGPVWDVWQAPGWTNVDTVNHWIAGVVVNIVGNRRIMVGARARRNIHTGEPEQRYIGDHACYEAHINEGHLADATFVSAIRWSGDRPVAEFDRFRTFGDPADDEGGKGSTDDDILQIVKASRARRVAVIIAAADHRGNVSDVGSGLFANAAKLRQILAPPAPPPPPPERPGPSFITVMYPDKGEVVAGKAFLISWATTDADRVELSSDVHGPIDHGLPPNGSIRQATGKPTIYVITAIGATGRLTQTFTVKVRPKPVPWWLALLRAFASLFR